MPFVGTGHLWIIAIVLVIVLIIWGPGKLPDVGSGLGRAIREFRKASTETREEFAKAVRPESSPPADAAPAPPAPGTGPQAVPGSVPEAAAPVGGGSTTAAPAERAAGEGDHTSRA
jgi:TatA/E family protein of Tat protein translocase